MLFISHDRALVSNFSEYIVVMYMGHIMESLPSGHIARDAAHPYTKALIGSVFPMGMDRGSDIAEMDAEPPSPSNMPIGCPFHPRCPIAEDRCRREAPVLRELAPEHRIACHLQ
jgi:oligopeptide/dipeptide ABC transporter ATP-binding protein